MLLVLWQSSAARAQSADPTFLILKYQHLVGKEVDVCVSEPEGKSCHSHFQLDFTGSSISLDANIQTDHLKRSISYVAMAKTQRVRS